MFAFPLSKSLSGVSRPEEGATLEDGVIIAPGSEASAYIARRFFEGTRGLPSMPTLLLPADSCRDDETEEASVERRAVEGAMRLRNSSINQRYIIAESSTFVLPSADGVQAPLYGLTMTTAQDTAISKLRTLCASGKTFRAELQCHLVAVDRRHPATDGRIRMFVWKLPKSVVSGTLAFPAHVPHPSLLSTAEWLAAAFTPDGAECSLATLRRERRAAPWCPLHRALTEFVLRCADVRKPLDDPEAQAEPSVRRGAGLRIVKVVVAQTATSGEAVSPPKHAKSATKRSPRRAKSDSEGRGQCATGASKRATRACAELCEGEWPALGTASERGKRKAGSAAQPRTDWSSIVRRSAVFTPSAIKA